MDHSVLARVPLDGSKARVVDRPVRGTGVADRDLMGPKREAQIV
jgi:hypothetical protein